MCELTNQRRLGGGLEETGAKTEGEYRTENRKLMRKLILLVT